MSRRSIILLIAALMAFPATAQFESTSEYQAGYKRGRVAGKDFAQNVGSGSEPNFEAMSNLKGAQDGFRGIKPSKRNADRYEALSEAVARPGVKLYSFSEAHEATIVSADPSNDRMVVRYRKTGATEPKSISALSQQWFARKDDPALRK